MSEQFKVGDAVRFTKEALCADSDLPEGLLRVLRTDIDGYVHYADPTESDYGTKGFCRPSWLEPAPVDLKAEKALLLSRISEIDKQIEAHAQGDGLSRLKAIVGETGYFRSSDAFYRYRYLEAGGIMEDDLIAGYYHVVVDEGYGFSALGAGDVEASRTNVCCCFPTDLEGWQSITMERFLRAKSDYEDIVQKVKEAMEP